MNPKIRAKLRKYEKLQRQINKTMREIEQIEPLAQAPFYDAAEAEKIIKEILDEP